MKLFFFRGKAPNFGDELNTYLLPRIFPDFFDEDPSTMFLAIGSILNQEHPAKAQKIVFGSGYGGYGPPPVLDDTWKVYGVRGPRTAHALGLDKRHVAADTAVLINRHRRPDFPKTIRCSFMPHWESLERADWARVCQLAGINFIDPRWPVQTVLDHIEGSEKVIAEAMHGAIVSDALRVPWVPVMPFKQTHRFKWFDWAEALDINLVTQRLRPSSVAECWVLMTQREGQRVAHPGPLLAPVFSVINAGLKRVAAQRLKALSFATPSLSSDESIERAIQRLQAHADEIKRQHRRVSI